MTYLHRCDNRDTEISKHFLDQSRIQHTRVEIRFYSPTCRGLGSSCCLHALERDLLPFSLEINDLENSMLQNTTTLLFEIEGEEEVVIH